MNPKNILLFRAFCAWQHLVRLFSEFLNFLCITAFGCLRFHETLQCTKKNKCFDRTTLPNAVMHTKVQQFNAFWNYGWKVEAISPKNIDFLSFSCITAFGKFV